MKNTLKCLLIIMVVLAASISLDQYTKKVAIQSLSSHKSISYFHDIFRLTLTKNPGAFLSLGSNMTEQLREVIFIGVVGVLLLGLLSYLLLNLSSHLTDIVGISLIFSGGISNLYDRIEYNGVVVDFMNIGVGSIRSGIFNVADLVIVIGIFLIMLTLNCKASIRQK